VDEQTKAKGLMAAGLLILAVIGLVVVLVVLPSTHHDGRTPVALAQGGPMPPSGTPGGEMPGMPGMPGAPGGMPGMPGAPGGGAPAAAGAAAAPAATGKAVEPLEPSRPNPFAPMGAVAGGPKKPSAGAAFVPGPRGMPIGLREQNRFPTVGPNGETIKVPSGAPSRRSTGPLTPPGQETLKVVAIMRDPQGRTMVVLQGAPGQPGVVLQVGDRYQGYRVERITNTELVLAKQEGGQIVRKTIRLQVGGAGRPAPPGGRPGVVVPGGRPGAGGQPPAGGGAQPGIRRPGGAAPGAFPGAGGGGGERRRPAPQQ